MSPTPMVVLAPTEAALAEAAAALRAGGLVGMPTETVYGLAARLDEAACRRVFLAKERPPTDPLIVHVCAPEQVWEVAEADGEAAAAVRALAARFWPGPLTIVLPRRPCVPAVAAAGLDTIGVRMPRHPVALELIRRAGPLAAPSANKFGAVSPVAAAHVAAAFPELPVLDGGRCELGLESTVLAVRPGAVHVHRRGAVTEEMVAEALQAAGLALRVGAAPVTSSAPADGPMPAPGGLLSHYALPGCMSVFLVADEALVAGLPGRRRVELAALAGARPAVVNCCAGFDVGPLAAALGAPLVQQIADAPARGYYYALHLLAAERVDLLVVVPPSYAAPAAGLAASVLDRVFRSCAGRYCVYG